MHQPLVELPRGATAIVVPGGILRDGAETTVRRLRHQGIVTGTELSIVRHTSGGGIVVAVGRSRIAIDPSVAAGLVVQIAEADDDHR